MSLIEAMVVVALVLVLTTAIAIPSYRSYASSRAAADAAATLAGDIGLLERAAQNSNAGEGSSLIVESDGPLRYSCYYGRPTVVDPSSSLGTLIVQRSFPEVVLSGGPISAATPLLFARNGSAQYVDATGKVAPQHATIEFALTSKDGARTVSVDLDLFTGAVSTH
jgi:Tfp pilus assembly protein PilE